MKVRLFLSDTHGSGYYRQQQPARVVGEEGHDTSVYQGEFTIYNAPVGRVICRTEPEDGGIRVTELDQDVAVFARPAKASLLEVIGVLRRRGAAIVVDVDDDAAALHPAHCAYADFHPSTSPQVNWKHLAAACRMADLVTTTTPALAERYAAHGRVAILPNCVPKAMLGMPRSSDGHTLGWAGDAKTHPGDLEVTRGAVQIALGRADGWRFQVIGGEADIVQERLGLTDRPAETGWSDVEQWQEMLGMLDVGIVPLGDTRFNAAKSWLKGIEYAARGVPFVASPTPEYERLAEEWVGVLAPDRARNWRREVLQLMDDESLREERAAMGRAAVAERHTYEGEGWRWAEAWSQAVSNRHQRAAA